MTRTLTLLIRLQKQKVEKIHQELLVLTQQKNDTLQKMSHLELSRDIESAFMQESSLPGPHYGAFLSKINQEADAYNQHIKTLTATISTVQKNLLKDLSVQKRYEKLLDEWVQHQRHLDNRKDQKAQDDTYHRWR